jgi:hypothetical protein
VGHRVIRFTVLEHGAMGQGSRGRPQSCRDETTRSPPPRQRPHPGEAHGPVEPGTTSHRDIAAIFGYWKAGKLPPDGLVKIEWIAVDVGAAAPRNTRI